MTAQDKLKLLYAYMAGCAYGGWYETRRLGRRDRHIEQLPDLCRQMLGIYKDVFDMSEADAQEALDRAVEVVERDQPGMLKELRGSL